MSTELLKRVIDNSELKEIRLVSLQVGQNSAVADVESKLKIDIGTPKAPIIEGEGADRTLRAICSIRVVGIVSGQHPLDFQANIEAAYKLSDPELRPEDCQLFVEKNVPFNVWPYARELLQSVTSRMLLPPVVLPLFKPSRLRDIKKERTAIAESKPVEGEKHEVQGN